MEDNTCVNVVILLVIIFSTACFVLETEFKSPDLDTTWFGLETFAVAVFSVEYTIRLVTCPNLRGFLLSPLNAIDALAILPYYVTLFIALADQELPWQVSSPVAGTTYLRAVRLARVFRIMKLGRYSAGMQVFTGALAHSATSLFLLCFLVIIIMILFSSIMYLVESEGDKSEAWCLDSLQNINAPECAFSTIPSTFWWAVVTITTVGYGDAIPNTAGGKVVAALTMICGIIVIALPISVLGNNFTKLMQQYPDESVIITQADQDGSGFVDLNEVHRWLVAMRRAGKVRDERITAEELVRRYDKGGKVGLERKEFLRMCRETVHQGGPSNRELLQKMIRLGEQLTTIQERLSALEAHVSLPAASGDVKPLEAVAGGGGASSSSSSSGGKPQSEPPPQVAVMDVAELPPSGQNSAEDAAASPLPMVLAGGVRSPRQQQQAPAPTDA